MMVLLPTELTKLKKEQKLQTQLLNYQITKCYKMVGLRKIFCQEMKKDLKQESSLSQIYNVATLCVAYIRKNTSSKTFRNIEITTNWRIQV